MLSGIVEQSDSAVERSERPVERPWWQFKPGVSGNPSGRSGKAQAERIAVEHRRQVVLDQLLVDLGRPPSAAELILLREASAMVVLCDRLRESGKPVPVENSRLITRNINSVFGQPRDGGRRRGRPLGRPPVPLSALGSSRSALGRRAQAVADASGAAGPFGCLGRRSGAPGASCASRRRHERPCDGGRRHAAHCHRRHQRARRLPCRSPSW